MEEVDRRFDSGRRRALASLIRATSPGAAARLDEVVEGDGLFVTTGQQPGLFTGPLYTVHKILSAVQLARELEAELGRPVAPLFWVASDDHDWEEANHTYLVDRYSDLHRITLGARAGAPMASMRNRLLGPEVEIAYQEFVENLPTTEFAGELLELLRETYSPEYSVAESFTKTIARLFAPFDLLIVDGGQPGLKALATDHFELELTEAALHESLFEEQSQALERAGYGRQVPVLPGATNLFHEDELGRERIFRSGKGYLLHGSERRFTLPELLAELRSDPGRFSANVVLRPIIESLIFPTIAYVGGPGEVSYFGQYRRLFEAHGIDAPVVFPRTSVLMVEPKIREVLDEFGLSPDEVGAPFHELSTRVIRDSLPTEVKGAISSIQRSIESGYDELEAASLSIDPMLAGPLQGGRNTSLVRLAEVERRIVRHLKKRRSIELARLERATANLYPDGQPQERMLNIFQYLARYGQELLPALASTMRVSLR